LLLHTDLPEIAASLAPRRVVLAGVMGPTGDAVKVDEARRLYFAADVGGRPRAPGGEAALILDPDAIRSRGKCGAPTPACRIGTRADAKARASIRVWTRHARVRAPQRFFIRFGGSYRAATARERSSFFDAR